MLLQCTNKGCRQESEALLDQASQNVICQECFKPIDNISPFVKRAMEGFNQVVKKNKDKIVPYGSKCQHCQKTTSPVANKGKYYCQHCQKELDFNPVYEHFLKTHKK